MKKRLVLQIFFGVLCLCSLVLASCTPAASPSPNSALSVALWIKQHAIPFNTAESGSSTSDLQPLMTMIGNVNIVALGEETHGTHEFFAMKERITEFLVQEKGFTVFALENSWDSSRVIDTYVMTGQGDPLTLLKNEMLFAWQRSEFLDLITWMRAYNANPQHLNKIHFAGIDCQTLDLSSFQNVVSYIQRVDPAQTAHVQMLYQGLDRTGGPYASESIGQATFRQYQAHAQQVYVLLQNNQAAYLARSSRSAFDLALQTARVIVQYTTLQAMGDIYQSAAAFSQRDMYMSENAQWDYEHEAMSGKMILSAHDIHIANDPTYNLGVDHQTNMGAYLRKRYGASYLAIGMSFYQGSFMAYDGTYLAPFTAALPSASSSNYTLGQVGIPRYFLDLRHLPAGSIKTWAQTPRPFCVINIVYDPSQAAASYNTGSLSQWFDILIHFQHTTPAHLLPGS